MRIGAIVGVKDEAELIAPCIERLEAIGVSAIVVLDDYSTDGTAEIVDAMAAERGGRLSRVTFVPDFKRNLHRDGPALGRLIGEHAPDWILFTDADEFWLPAGDDLQTIVARAQTDSLLIDRFNMPLGDAPFGTRSGVDPAPSLDAPLIAERTRLSRGELSDPNARWVTHAIGPKMLCQADRFGAFEPGAHSARGPRQEKLSCATLADLIIAHVPLTTYARFELKVENTRAFFARWSEHYPGDLAWHWKHWIELKDQGKLPEEFERQRMSAAEMATLIDAGVIKSARALLAERTR